MVDQVDDAAAPVMTAPKLWEFKGHAAQDTYFELRVIGRPNAKALRNIIRQVELYHQFIAEDEADALSSEAQRQVSEAKPSAGNLPPDEPLPASPLGEG